MESQVRFCTIPCATTGFYNPPAQCAAGGGEDERQREGADSGADESVHEFMLNSEETLEIKRKKYLKFNNRKFER